MGVNTTAFGRKLTLFSAITLSRFSLKMSRFFLGISSWKKCTLSALISVKWNSDESATSFPCSAKLTRSAKFLKCYVFWPDCSRVKYIPGYRRSGKIGEASRRCTTVSVAPPGGGKNTNSRFSRFFVRSVPLFRSLMLTPMLNEYYLSVFLLCAQ